MGTLSDEDIYRKHADHLVRFATGLVGRSDGPDIVSAAVLKSISSPAWSLVTNHRAYLNRAVLNQARQTLVDPQRRWAKELRVARVAGSPNPEHRPDVVEAVRELSLLQRAVVILAYWDTLTVPEIAAELKLSDRTVRRHLALARAKLKRVLDD